MTIGNAHRYLRVVGGTAEFAAALNARFGGPDLTVAGEAEGGEGLMVAAGDKCFVLLQPRPDGDSPADWLLDVHELLDSLPAARVILLSSIEVYSPDHHSLGLVEEDTTRRPTNQNKRSRFWEDVECGVGELVEDGRLLVFRVPQVIGLAMASWFDDLLNKPIAVTAFGYDPAIQFIDEEALIDVLAQAMEKGLSGVYNTTPADSLPLWKLLKVVGVRRLPVPWLILRFFNAPRTQATPASAPADRLDFLRYPCTASGEKFALATGIRLSAKESLVRYLEARKPSRLPLPDLSSWSDPRGSDVPFVRDAGESWTMLKFLEKGFWRVERKGFENIPKTGPAILVGPHRGFMPLDAVMMVNLVTKYVGRVPRFLVHPTLVKFSVLGRFMRRMGAVMACKKNADEILEDGDLLGIYPEGIRGAFKLYKDIYQLGRFGRPDHAKFSLEHDVPIIPFVITGCAETFPILARMKWRWVKRYIEWPYFPLTPTFPLVPIPLPTKWHIHVRPAVNPGDFLEAAGGHEREQVRLIVAEVKERIEKATEEMLEKRPSIFHGNVWDE